MNSMDDIVTDCDLYVACLVLFEGVETPIVSNQNLISSNQIDNST